ncbi:MAG: hypothetical protein ACRCS3_08925, partial [Paracoccaceae bacterium]
MTPDDLRAGEAAGIVTEAQAASLQALAHGRAGARENLAPGDEPFELFKGFNEIFIVVGLGILAMGYAGVAGIWVAVGYADLPTRTFIAALIGVGILWLLAEYFVRRRRMIAPAIALSVMFAGCA